MAIGERTRPPIGAAHQHEPTSTIVIGIDDHGCGRNTQIAAGSEAVARTAR